MARDFWGFMGWKKGMKLEKSSCMEFCASNQLTIMNTWFKKKEIHLSTWMHPATNKCHNNMIDFIVMREGQRMFCKIKL